MVHWGQAHCPSVFKFECRELRNGGSDVFWRFMCCCSPAEAAGTLDWEDPYGRELNTSGIKAYGRAKLQVGRARAVTAP